MQIAGIPCLVCSRAIVVDSDGSGCATCNSVAHWECIGGQNWVCPRCRTPWLDFRSGGAYAMRCASCGSRNRSPPEKWCRVCQTLLWFDSVQALQEEKQRVHRLGTRHLLGSFVLTCAWISLFAAFFGVFRAWQLFFFPVLFAVAVFFAGLFMIVKAIKLARQGWLCLRFR
jgi:hypothetical protein